MTKLLLFIARLLLLCLLLQPISVAFIDYTPGTYILAFWGFIALHLGVLYVVDIIEPD